MQALDYVAPNNVDEAISALADGGERARPLSGGTDLIAQLQEGRLGLDTIVDLKRIPELMAISVSSDSLTIGASVSCHTINANQSVRDAYPALIDSTHLIGGTQNPGARQPRRQPCNSSPAAIRFQSDCPLRHLSYCRPSGRRSVAVEDFCTAAGRMYWKTVSSWSRWNSPRRPRTSAQPTCVSFLATKWTLPSSAPAPLLS